MIVPLTPTEGWTFVCWCLIVAAMQVYCLNIVGAYLATLIYDKDDPS